MNIKYDNFIGIYEEAFSKEYCDSAIKYFDAMDTLGFAKSRQFAENIDKLQKDDLLLFCHDSSTISANGSGKLVIDFNNAFWNQCYREYASNYSILRTAGGHSSYSVKIQKTLIGGGYHMWHFESDCRSSSHRVLAWMLYLNDVEEGGETEFLYLSKRIKPKAGTLLIWPAGFTHTHRGNPPLSNNKYIMTGWVEF